MCLISDEGYINAVVHLLRILKTHEIWPSMRDVGSGMGVKHKCNLVLKEMHGVLQTKKTYKRANYKIQND